MSRNVTGLGMVTEECTADLQFARSTEWAVYQKAAQCFPGECENCGGIGEIVLGFAPGYEGKDKVRASWIIDARSISVEVRRYPCPVCSKGEVLKDMNKAWAQSGLEPDEYLYSLEFIRGLEGKEDALAAAISIQSQAPHPHGWLTLWGNYGVGKSGILKALTGSIIKSGGLARYCRSADLLEYVRSEMGDGGNTSAALNRFRSYSLLAIDEIDRISDSNWAHSTLMSLLDARYNLRFRACTVLALNRNPAGLGPEWGYLVSRIEDSNCYCVCGSSLRR